MLTFLGIGAQKAGTTWLHSMLSHHPSINFPLGKEIHYWNKHYPKRPVNEYLNHFTRLKLTEGEITPAYGHLPLDTIQTIYQHLPELKLIYLLRNPVERAWSSAIMALGRAEMEFDEASDAWFIDHFNSKGSRLRGAYINNINNWLKVFPESSLLLLLHDDIKTQPANVLNNVCQHLNISPFSGTALANMPLNKKIFAGKQHSIRPALKFYLLNLYQAEIHSLSSHLNIDLSHWEK